MFVPSLAHLSFQQSPDHLWHDVLLALCTICQFGPTGFYLCRVKLRHLFLNTLGQNGSFWSLSHMLHAHEVGVLAGEWEKRWVQIKLTWLLIEIAVRVHLWFMSSVSLTIWRIKAYEINNIWRYKPHWKWVSVRGTNSISSRKNITLKLICYLSVTPPGYFGQYSPSP